MRDAIIASIILILAGIPGGFFGWKLTRYEHVLMSFLAIGAVIKVLGLRDPSALPLVTLIPFALVTTIGMLSGMTIGERIRKKHDTLRAPH